MRRIKERRVVFVLRKCSRQSGVGAGRTITAVAKAEDRETAEVLVRKHVTPGTEIWTDESPAYAGLSAWYDHKVVNHSVMYVTPDGVHENQAESSFARLRRGQYGSFHGMRPRYLADYADEMAWRESMRRRSTNDRLQVVREGALNTGRSLWWSGYWQGGYRRHELLTEAPARRRLPLDAPQ